MKLQRFVLPLLFTLLLALIAASAQAKTLVYCSEGSPEGFTKYSSALKLHDFLTIKDHVEIR